MRWLRGRLQALQLRARPHLLLALRGLIILDWLIIHKAIEPISHRLERLTGADCFHQRRGCHLTLALVTLTDGFRGVRSTEHLFMRIGLALLSIGCTSLWLWVGLYHPPPQVDEWVRDVCSRGYYNPHKFWLHCFTTRIILLVLFLANLGFCARLLHIWPPAIILGLCTLADYLDACNPLPPAPRLRILRPIEGNV